MNRGAPDHARAKDKCSRGCSPDYAIYRYDDFNFPGHSNVTRLRLPARRPTPGRSHRENCREFFALNHGCGSYAERAAFGYNKASRNRVPVAQHAASAPLTIRYSRNRLAGRFETRLEFSLFPRRAAHLDYLFEYTPTLKAADSFDRPSNAAHPCGLDVRRKPFPDSPNSRRANSAGRESIALVRYACFTGDERYYKVAS